MITNKQIEEVLEQFNFIRVARLYQILSWKWHDKDIPNSDELRESASSKLKRLQESYPKVSSIESGGLKVRAYEEELYEGKIKTVVKLEFIAHSSIA